MDQIIKKFTDVERARYDFMKDLSLRSHPSIQHDNIKLEMAEYLFIYYAQNGILPDKPLDEEINNLLV